ncbi:VOC family protein [Sphingomonas bacterium]|uniref:VOC family protein n=1 Tax=Sphingomonas bacterium TaxID=1895847 RepID=UPI0015762D3A|nr:VOC family protein [Sphingomonas bacterium]
MATALHTAPPATADAIVPPARLAHVVLRTSRFDEMVAWYKLVLNSHAAFESEHIAFLAYDDEHHRVALIHIPGLAPAAKGTFGVHHFAFTYDSMRDLLTNYAKLRDHGIKPVWGVNHGPTTSLYYADPEGNNIELQVDNCDTVEEAGEFFFTENFRQNAIGVDVDPEDLYQRLLAGEDEASLKTYHPIGPRAVEDSPLEGA